MKWFSAIASLGMGLAYATLADAMHYEDYWKEAHHPGVEIEDYPKETVVTDTANLTVYIFTKPNNPAHPGVIVRKLVNEGGGAYFDTTGHSDGPDSAQDVFKTWMNNPLQ